MKAAEILLDLERYHDNQALVYRENPAVRDAHRDARDRCRAALKALEPEPGPPIKIEPEPEYANAEIEIALSDGTIVKVDVRDTDTDETLDARVALAVGAAGRAIGLDIPTVRKAPARDEVLQRIADECDVHAAEARERADRTAHVASATHAYGAARAYAHIAQMARNWRGEPAPEPIWRKMASDLANDLELHAAAQERKGARVRSHALRGEAHGLRLAAKRIRDVLDK